MQTIFVFVKCDLGKAYEVAEAGTIQPFAYFQLVFVTLLALVFFDERPDAWTIAGGGLILAAGLYTLIRQARLDLKPQLRRRHTDPPPARIPHAAVRAGPVRQRLDTDVLRTQPPRGPIRRHQRPAGRRAIGGDRLQHEQLQAVERVVFSGGNDVTDDFCELHEPELGARNLNHEGHEEHEERETEKRSSAFNERRTPNVELRTSNSEPRTPNVELRTWHNERITMNPEPRT